MTVVGVCVTVVVVCAETDTADEIISNATARSEMRTLISFDLFILVASKLCVGELQMRGGITG